MRYLNATVDLDFVYKNLSGDPLIGFVDADYAADATNRKSTNGYLFKVL